MDEQAMAKLNTKEYWQWLNNFLTLLRNMVEEAEVLTMDAKAEDFSVMKLLAELRLSERTLNFFIDQFMHKVEKENMALTEFFTNKMGAKENPLKQWYALKSTRDNLADRISTLMEKDPKMIERYGKFCDNLKNVRSIGATL